MKEASLPHAREEHEEREEHGAHLGGGGGVRARVGARSACEHLRARGPATPPSGPSRDARGGGSTFRGPPSGRGEGAAPSADEESDVLDDRQRWVVCAACRARLAEERARIAVNGAHEHTFMNPTGLRFVVVCFAAAPGCVAEGERSTVWTWFPGSAWQIELCGACGAHVGWSFHRDQARFYGLIQDRLA